MSNDHEFDEYLALVDQAPYSPAMTPMYVGYILSYNPQTGTAVVLNPMNSNLGSDGTVQPITTQEMLCTSFWGAPANTTNPIRNDILPYGFQVCPFGGATEKIPQKGEQCLVLELNNDTGGAVLIAMTFPDPAPPPGSQPIPVSGLSLKNGEMLLIAPGGLVVHVTSDGSCNLFALPIPAQNGNPQHGGNINAVAGGGVNLFAQKIPSYVVPAPFTINVYADQQMNIQAPTVSILAQNPAAGSPNLSTLLLEALGLNGYAQSVSDIEIISRSGINTENGTATLNMEAIAQDSPGTASSNAYLRSHAGGVVSGIANALTEIDVQANDSGTQTATLQLVTWCGQFGNYNANDQANTLLRSEGYNATTSVLAGDPTFDPFKVQNGTLTLQASGAVNATTNVNATIGADGVAAIAGLTAQTSGPTGTASASLNSIGANQATAVVLAQSASSISTGAGVFITADGQTNPSPASITASATGTAPNVALSAQGTSASTADADFSVSSVGGGSYGATLTMLADGETNGAGQANVSNSARSGGGGNATWSATADASNNGDTANIGTTATAGQGSNAFTNFTTNGGDNGGHADTRLITTGGSNGAGLANGTWNVTGGGSGAATLILDAIGGSTAGAATANFQATGTADAATINIVSNGNDTGGAGGQVNIQATGTTNGDIEIFSNPTNGRATVQAFANSTNGAAVANLFANATAGGAGAGGTIFINASGDSTASQIYLLSDGDVFIDSNGPNGMNIGANNTGTLFLTTNNNTLNVLSGLDLYLTSVTDTHIWPDGNLDVDLTGGTGNATFQLTNGSPFAVGATSIQLGRGTLRALIDSRILTLLNNHKHSGVSTGSGTSGTPTTTFTAASCATTDTTAS